MSPGTSPGPQESYDNNSKMNGFHCNLSVIVDHEQCQRMAKRRGLHEEIVQGGGHAVASVRERALSKREYFPSPQSK